ncbi:MAG TPA: response regulator transcription factor [Bryobacteraceae bacterium]|jgi:two-component system response regulator CpxR|nr:response regulator transcription factor [Bryobacteraceae bacterium]
MVPNDEQSHEKSSSETVLLIDDDTELCSMLQDYLGRHGWKVTARHSGQAGLKSALEDTYGIILLDVMLPDIDGFEVLRRLRAQSAIHVLLLTARGDDVDRIVGLELGADDYLPKPFNPRELVARMRAISRRGSQLDQTASSRAAAGFSVDNNRRRISFRDQPLDLTDIEFLLLSKLLQRPYEVVSREELTEDVLERPFRPLDRSIDMHVSRLRRKLEALRTFHGSIRGIRNSGYMFTLNGEERA